MMRFGTFLAAAVGLAALSLASCEDPPAPASSSKPAVKAQAASCPPVTQPACPPVAAKGAAKTVRAKARRQQIRTRVYRSTERRYETGEGLAGGERYTRYVEREYPRPTGDYYRSDRSTQSSRTYRRYEGQSQYVPPPPPPPRYEGRGRAYAYEREESQSESRSERRYEESEAYRSGGSGMTQGRGCDRCGGQYGTQYSFERYGTYYAAGRDRRGMLVWPGKTD
jgi:hypothetical protein